MSRLVIVSNRVADLSQPVQAGGLTVGLADALRERGGIWFGWNGSSDAEGDEEPEVEEAGEVCRISLPLTRRDYEEYYIGYANSVLWPLFHYRLDLVDFRQEFFEGYCRVNERFARALQPFLRPDDVIWVHDYHLIPLAGFLRRLGCRQRIGFFLHIPFPPPEMLSASPNHRRLVEALLVHDVVGMQTHSDVGNLEHHIEDHALATRLGEGTYRAGDREVRIGRFPIGIDVDSFAAMAAEPDREIQIEAMRRQILGRKQIIGVDRLDYSKGLPDRMKAVARMISQHPELEGTVSFLQIAPPTREELRAYSDIRVELEALAGAINGHFGRFNWMPIHYIHRAVPRDQLARLFRGSEVGLVTPLRDGMNLVAKEYVAAQDPDNPGVLVLSRFAGAAEELHDALIVNPYDVDDVAEALRYALAMPAAERRRRHEALLQVVRRHDAGNWLREFLRVLEGGRREVFRAENSNGPTGGGSLSFPRRGGD